MRFGGPVFQKITDPDSWIKALKAHGYTAAYCPLDEKADARVVQEYAKAAGDSDIVIAEVGAWSNPLSPDAATRAAALQVCRDRLDLAERIGARCCVNIAGSRGQQWDGPHPDNLTQATFDLIVESVRAIVDEVKPRRAFYTLETMPWMYPDSVESYERLLAAVDRPRFAVHFDPVNLVCSPQRFYGNAQLIREFIARLGPRIKSCHAKDIVLSSKLTTHLDEARPGLGGLDYAAFLRGVNGLDPLTPVMLEHLSTAEEYDDAARHVRSVASGIGLHI
jgi:sugar phosphate isomerase/epimerase